MVLMILLVVLLFLRVEALDLEVSKYQDVSSKVKTEELNKLTAPAKPAEEAEAEEGMPEGLPPDLLPENLPPPPPPTP